MQTSRQRILNYLEKNRQASAVELSQVLDLTQANIRHHLGVLERDGKIELVGEVPSGGRGRPSLMYMLSKSEQAGAVDVLASLLLRKALEGVDERKQERLLADLARRLAGKTDRHGSITIRLGNAVRQLEDFHYKAHWEAHPEGPHIFFGSCPYAALITQHPELCRMDRSLLENLTGEQVEQLEKQNRSPQGPAYCIFLVKSHE